MPLFSHMQIVGFLMRWLNCNFMRNTDSNSFYIFVHVCAVGPTNADLCPNMYFGGLTKLLISHLQVAPLFDSVHICVECWINFRQNCYHNQDLQSSNYNV